ncbi:MAG TPA: peptide ABC transporter substrate-binding protein [Candidatus Saccharimonadales bacterium]|nr:peptide ABC transporter substrate-binding protein [Candidatus Saccharimonadales bacterium]
MGERSKRFRLPKAIRSQHKNIGEFGTLTEEKIDRHFFHRLANLAKVKRFVAGWLILMSLILLIGFLQLSFLRDKYQNLYFTPGGTFTEGIVGTYTNANPIYASSSVDSSVSKLLFAGLLTYDSNQKLIPDLAESITANKKGKVYTVTLRPDLYWHDGQPLTANDVLFTFKTIQNPDAKSYLLPSWQGIEISATDERTVTFELPSTLSSFPDSLTTGILPEHVLKDIPPERLRASDFNTVRPIGSGPFKYDTVEVQIDEEAEPETRREQIGLIANDGYYKGQPGIKRYVINTYDTEDKLVTAYDEKKVDAISGLGTIKKEYREDEDSNVYSIPVAGQTMVFFKNSQGILSDTKVRRALVLGADRYKVMQSTGQILKRSDEPLLIGQLGYDRKYAQKTTNSRAARQILDKAGWKLNPATGIRSKGNTELRLKLYALSNNEYEKVANELKNEWREIGVDVQTNLQGEEDLKNTVSSRSYDALLSTISIGADPDVFAFWHSSQNDARSRARLNFSEYESAKADISLEGGRSRIDPKIRAVKYQTFLKVWNNDNPALALYQPNYTFVVRSPFTGFDNSSLISPVYRYSDVDKWMIKQERR